MRHTSGRYIGVLIAIGSTLAACGSDGSSAPSDTAAPATASSAPISSETSTAPDSSSPDTTDSDASSSSSTPPSTTATTTVTTEAQTSTSLPPDTGWEVSEFVPGAAVQGYSGNWWGEAGPSPAAPTGTNPPADGYYAATLREPWDPAQPDTLAVRIQRLELCTVLPGGCDNMEDPTEMNLDPTWQLDLDLPLDATTDVVVGGFKCWDAPEQKQGTGVELADLFTAYTDDYETAVAPLLAAGTSSWDVAQQVAAAPTGGFVAEATMCPDDSEMPAGPLRYAHDDTPVLLLQTVTDGDGGPLEATELVQLGGVEYTDGVPLVYFYAGFYS